MTIAELNNKLIETTQEQIFNNALTEAALTVQDEMSNRIFVELENVAGNKASSADYSTKEIWVEPLTLPRKSAGSAIGKRGKPIKTRYFEGGWADVKAQVGRKNYELNGILFKDFNSPLINFGGDLRVVLKLKKPENNGKVKGLNKKYGRTFGVNKEERDLFARVLQFEVAKQINEDINA
jgi:hypothetical protein